MSYDYDAIVIGSGLGGLSAGALYARTGRKVLLLERNHSFGGAATTYTRGPLTIEASLHETADPRKVRDPKGKVFEALDLYDDVELIPVGDFYEVRSPIIGASFTMPHGFEAIEARLVERFPAQAKGIRSFLLRVRRIQSLLDFMGAKPGTLDWLSDLPEVPLELWSALRDYRSSLSDVLQRCFGDDETIKLVLAANLPYYADDPDTFWWLGYAVAQGGFLRGGGHYIKGGSQTLSDRLVEIIREEGGTVLSGHEATGIDLNAEGEVTAVRYRPRDGGAETVARAPVVFANAAPNVIQAMLPAEQREAFMAPHKDKTPSTSLFSITLGLNRRPTEIGFSRYTTVLLPEWMKKLSDYKHSAKVLSGSPEGRMPALAVVDYSQIDSGLREEGDLFPISVVGPDRLSNWSGLSEEAYRQKRDAWLDAITARLETEWPGFGEAVADRVMATARTMHDYLNTPEGAIYGFTMCPPTELPKGMPISADTPIKGLLLSSAFAGAGGFTGAMSAGVNAAQTAMRMR